MQFTLVKIKHYLWKRFQIFFSSIEVANFSIDEDNNLNILSIFPKQFVSKKESETIFFFFFTNYVLKVMIKVKLGKRSQSDRKGQ